MQLRKICYPVISLLIIVYVPRDLRNEASIAPVFISFSIEHYRNSSSIIYEKLKIKDFKEMKEIKDKHFANIKLTRKNQEYISDILSYGGRKKITKI